MIISKEIYYMKIEQNKMKEQINELYSMFIFLENEEITKNKKKIKKKNKYY